MENSNNADNAFTAGFRGAVCGAIVYAFSATLGAWLEVRGKAAQFGDPLFWMAFVAVAGLIWGAVIGGVLGMIISGVRAGTLKGAVFGTIAGALISIALYIVFVFGDNFESFPVYIAVGHIFSGLLVGAIVGRVNSGK